MATIARRMVTTAQRHGATVTAGSQTGGAIVTDTEFAQQKAKLLA